MTTMTHEFRTLSALMMLSFLVGGSLGFSSQGRSSTVLGRCSQQQPTYIFSPKARRTSRTPSSFQRLYGEPSPSSSSEPQLRPKVTATSSKPSDGVGGANQVYLGQSTNGGYTVKQRLREEVESPFRKVRLAFFAASVASASIALYFSALSTLKAVVGGYADAMPLDEALTSDAINLGAVVVCGVLAYREYKAGEANLARISRGGRLASLVVEPAGDGSQGRLQLTNYRRSSRVVIAAGGEAYLSTLARSLASDQLADENIVPARLADVDVVVVPVLLLPPSSDRKVAVGDTRAFWKEIQGRTEDRNFDVNRANGVVSFPIGGRQWGEYLESEIDTANSQGFDVLQKGITLTVKKNGRILRRATGQPPWGDLIGTMEVMDGSRFGMPGDSEKYEGT